MINQSKPFRFGLITFIIHIFNYVMIILFTIVNRPKIM